MKDKEFSADENGLTYAEAYGIIDTSYFDNYISKEKVKMKKRMLLLFAVVAAMMACFSFLAGAASESDLTFELNSDGESYYVADCRQSANGKLIIPSVYNGKPVISIGSNAFESCSELISITIPDSVTSIGDFAFLDCTGFTSITIPDSVTSIGSGALCNCDSLTSITMPFVGASQNSAGKLYFGYFFGAHNDSYNRYVPSSLKKVTITAPCEKIGEYAFRNCKELTSITISDSVTSIGDCAFINCGSLKSITIPDSVTSIGFEAFYGCKSLTSITLPFVGASKNGTGNNHFGYIFGARGYGNQNDYIPSSLKEVVITAPCEKIDKCAFWYCAGLTSITIPDSLTMICDSAFSCCTGLTSFTFPGSVTSIGDGAFSNCTSLTSIVVPDSVTSIGGGAFRGCASLTSITLPFVGGSKDIEYGTYFGFIFGANGYMVNSEYIPSSLNEIIITAPCEEIDDHAFCNYARLTSITLPDSITSIGDYAFLYCKNLKNIFFTGSKSQWSKISKTNCGIDTSKTTVHYEGCKGVCRKTTTERTCTTDSKEIYSCACGAIRSERVIASAYGHDYSKSYKVSKKATLTEDGSKYQTCSRCSGKKSSKIYKVSSVKLSSESYTYNGKVQTPAVTVKDSKGNTLKKDTDYTVKYESGRKATGTYTVTVTFKGKYSGTKALKYTIAPKATSKVTASQTTSTITLKWNKVTGATGYRVEQYNSKTKKWVSVKTLSGTSLKISKLSAGTVYKFRVKAYKKDEGTIWGGYSAVFETATKCKTPSITKISSAKKGVASFAWSNVAGETGYEVYYSTKKDSGYKKVASYKVNVVKGSKKKLTSGKKYYFKVRAYKKTASGTVYSAWSAAKSVKIK